MISLRLMVWSYYIIIAQSSYLGDKAARKEWETTFDKTYIQPVTRNLDQNIKASLNAILKDSEHQGI